MSVELGNLESFPNPAYVGATCKPGPNQCRFLMGSEGSYTCGRFTEKDEQLVLNIQNPVNCGGILEQIGLLKAQLVGLRTIYRASTLTTVEAVADIDVKDDVLSLELKGYVIPFCFQNPIIEVSGGKISIKPRQRIPGREEVTISLSKERQVSINGWTDFGCQK